MHNVRELLLGQSTLLIYSQSVMLPKLCMQHILLFSLVAEPKGEASNRGARVAMSLYTVQVTIYPTNLNK